MALIPPLQPVTYMLNRFGKMRIVSESERDQLIRLTESKNEESIRSDLIPLSKLHFSERTQ